MKVYVHEPLVQNFIAAFEKKSQTGSNPDDRLQADKQIVVYLCNGIPLSGSSNRAGPTDTTSWVNIAQGNGGDDCKGAQENFGAMEICIVPVLFILIKVVVALV